MCLLGVPVRVLGKMSVHFLCWEWTICFVLHYRSLHLKYSEASKLMEGDKNNTLALQTSSTSYDRQPTGSGSYLVASVLVDRHACTPTLP